MGDGGQALSFVCANQSWIGPVLAAIIPVGLASFLSGFADKLPPAVGHTLNVLGLNWVDVARAIAQAIAQPKQDNEVPPHA